ncbi:MAG TPA: carboxypeptidase-like regulatory domain-containing protein, partial [Candidatus Thermoplasmatota archaeon]|nr:carboxypeptidase-like regulatory domain-containing protein [Candidatus Thermoplasmatota archaeon]
DNRMLPYDNPQTPDIDAGSILYAPIFLANKNPDDFVQTVYVSGNNEYSVKAYETNEQGTSVQLDPVEIVDANDRCYFVSGGLLFRATEDCKRIDYAFNGGEGLPVSAVQLRLKDAYYRTMFYRGFVGGDKPAFGDYPPEAFEGNGTAGKGLRHWRLVNATNAVKLLQYYRGAVVSGKVELQTGGSLAGFTVAAADPFGIEHDSVVVGPDGRYSLLAPFNYAEEGPVQILVKQGDSIIATQRINISQDQAQRRVNHTLTVDIAIQPATVEGFTYFDRDRDRQYNASVDQPLAGVSVSVDGTNVTTGPDGRFRRDGALPGQKTVTATKAGYAPGSATANVAPGGVSNVSIAMPYATVPVNGTLKAPNGIGLASLSVTFTPVNPGSDYTADASAFTDEAGDFKGDIVPGGQYRVEVNGTTFEDNKTYRYQGQTTIDVPFGSAGMRIEQSQFALTRTEEA